MAYGVGASGFVGLEAETVAGTWVTPSIYVPLLEESLNYVDDKIMRRPLKGIADLGGMLPGNQHIEGNLKVEVTTDTFPFLLRAARMTCVKTGAGPYTYAFTPNTNVVPAKTLSITVVRNGVVFGYAGCVVGSQKYSITDGILVCELGIVGRSESVQTLPTATFSAVAPPATGQFTLQFATVTNTEADKFELNIDDKAESQFRLQGGNVRTPVFVKYGEREVTLSIDRDFQDRTDYDAFKALTAQAIDMKCVQNAGTSEVNFNVPTAVKETYEIQGLKNQGDLIRASISYQGVYDTVTSKSYSIQIIGAATITIP